MSRRGMKQLIYGFFLFIFLAFCVWVFYLAFLQPGPTCTDGKRNQDEVEVDCGGPYCSDCELRRVQSVRATPALAVSSPDGKRSSLLIQLQNPNATYGANPLVYDIIAYGEDGGTIYTSTVQTFIYPSEITYRIEPNIPVASTLIAKSEIRIKDQNWVRRSDFSIPRTQLRNMRVEYDEQQKRAVVSGVIKNDNPFILPRAIVNVILDGPNGSLAGVSKTLLDGLQPLEERLFSVIVPVVAGDKDTVFQQRVFIETKR